MTLYDKNGNLSNILFNSYFLYGVTTVSYTHLTVDILLDSLTDPGVLNPYEFIGTVINKRLPNPFMPDAPQRIATDTSQDVYKRQLLNNILERFPFLS